MRKVESTNPTVPEVLDVEGQGSIEDLWHQWQYVEVFNLLFIKYLVFKVG